MKLSSFYKVTANGLQIPEGGDYEAQNYQINHKCLTEAQTFISALTPLFWVYAVMCRFSSQKLNKMLTVGKLKKALKGIDDKTPIYLADHDHSEWETNGRAYEVELINQKDFDNHIQGELEKNSCFKIDGNYLVIRVG